MMKLETKFRALLAGAALLGGTWACFAANGPAPAPAPPVLAAMQAELDRSMAALSTADPAAYFISYTVSDRQYSEVSGSNGALLSSADNRARWLEVQSRVGTYQLDNTHKLGDRPPSWTSPGTSVAIDDDIPVLRREIWRRRRRAGGNDPGPGYLSQLRS